MKPEKPKLLNLILESCLNFLETYKKASPDRVVLFLLPYYSYLSFMKPKMTYLLILLTFGVILPDIVIAQRQVKQFYKNDGTQVRRERDADYIRIFRKEHSQDPLYVLTEYYPDQQVKRTGKVSDVGKPLLFEGEVISYYPNGEKRFEAIYERGMQVGTATHYYENGQLHKKVKHAIFQIVLSGGLETARKPDTLLWFYDPSGEVKVAEGNGFVRETDSEQDFEEGEYRDGVREGEWKGSFLKQKYTFTETYKGGILVSGESVDENNNRFPYSNMIISAKFGSTSENSIDQFRVAVQKIFKLPARAVRAQASGVVRVEFVIDENGETTEFKILEDPGYGLGYEAINAIKLAGKWTPGLNRGVPVRVRHELPLRINFRTTN